jgi:hypothetical protein
LLGQELRERRNGGQARIDVEARRNDLGHSVDLYVEGGQQLVDLTNPKLTSGSQTVLSDTFTSGAFGAVYTISGLSRPRPYWMRLEPRIQGASAQNGRFYNIGASGTYHQDSLGAFSFEVKVHFADASRNVPIYETPSFGGVNVMRGFRADDILARRFWSTQPELWFGVPNTFGKEGKIASFLSRNVRLATFFDAGGVYHTAAGDPSGLRGGPGAGVRVDFHQATVRLDWAYGLGQAATASCCGKVYFSVSRPLF